MINWLSDLVYNSTTMAYLFILNVKKLVEERNNEQS